MGDGLRTIHAVTTDETLLAQLRAAIPSLEGWEAQAVESVGSLMRVPPAAGDVILLDKWMRGENVYELCRRLTGRTRCRTFVVAEHANDQGEAIARFCGATGMVFRPLSPSSLRSALQDAGRPRPALPSEGRESGGMAELPASLLVDIATGQPDANLIAALTDPETSLFNFAFLNYKLDEEFKRSLRFRDPLSCVMLGFEGQASPEVVRELAGIILSSSRDTDVLGRFDESSFLFLLPRTGPDGARIMAQRVGEQAQERGLVDLVGDPLQISVGISCSPHADVRRREDLFGLAREAFLHARACGGGVVART